MTGLRRIYADNPVHMVGVEAYNIGPFAGVQGGRINQNAAGKTMAVMGQVIAFSQMLGLHIQVFRPADLKRRFCNDKSASKLEVRQALYKQVVNLKELIEAKPKGEHEHLGDAAGHAVLVLEELDSLRQAMGIR